jgi:hypothetical protein
MQLTFVVTIDLEKYENIQKVMVIIIVLGVL